MAGLRTFDDKRARIRAIAADAPPTAAAELRRFLADKNGYLVGEAADAVKQLELAELAPDLAAAFPRLCEDGVKVDKGCFGKNRVVEALLAFDAREPDVYLAGLAYQQLEPAFGAPIDAAAGLRGLCAHGLVHIDHPTALLDVAPLLADREAITRAEAATALGNSGIDAAAAVLHVKALAGDAEADVLGACYKGLLRLAPRRYLRFVASVLDGGEEGAEAAALALGESRVPEALPVLQRALEGFRAARLRDEVMLAIALLRSDEGNAFLIGLVEKGAEGEAAAALGALALHRHDEKVVERLRRAVAGRGKKIARVFEEKFV
jgi:hypothetical protein